MKMLCNDFLTVIRLVLDTENAIGEDMTSKIIYKFVRSVKAIETTKGLIVAEE